MRVEYQEALRFFHTLPRELQAPYLSPEYIRLDALRDPGLIPFFWCDEYEGCKFYLPGHISRVPLVGYEKWHDIQSAYGGGGPLFYPWNQKTADFFWQRYEAWCRENNILLEFFRFYPPISNHDWYRGKIIDVRNTISINLEDKRCIEYKKGLRYDIRKLKREGYYVEELEYQNFIEVFKDIYTERMEEIGADDFYFFHDEYFDSLVKSDMSINIVCKKDTEILAAAIFLKRGAYIDYHLSAANEAGRKAGASKLLIDYITRKYTMKDFKELYLGGGTTSNKNDPLLFFKQRFSKIRREFKIGYKIYNEELYKEMKKCLYDKDRIIFYR